MDFDDDDDDDNVSIATDAAVSSGDRPKCCSFLGAVDRCLMPASSRRVIMSVVASGTGHSRSLNLLWVAAEKDVRQNEFYDSHYL
jgi:hypothetical protein